MPLLSPSKSTPEVEMDSRHVKKNTVFATLSQSYTVLELEDILNII